MKERTIFTGVLATFAAAYFLPVANPKVQEAALDALRTLQWYARYHTLCCVVPAMFIAGAIATFLSKERILKYLGPNANKATAYGVASISGTLLAVCSCSVLPIFAGIYRVGAGLGPACAFLCSGPALSVVAIFLTSSVLGVKIGVARTVLAIAISLIVGLLMSAIFHATRRNESRRRSSFRSPRRLAANLDGRSFSCRRFLRFSSSPTGRTPARRRLSCAKAPS